MKMMNIRQRLGQYIGDVSWIVCLATHIEKINEIVPVKVEVYRVVFLLRLRENHNTKKGRMTGPSCC
jgi:exonuclease I